MNYTNTATRRLRGYITPNNTQVTEHEDLSIVTLHRTNVVVWDREAQTVTLNSGGWETVTTKRRMNEAAMAFGLDFKVYSKAYEWFVDTPSGGTLSFRDGITFSSLR